MEKNKTTQEPKGNAGKVMKKEQETKIQQEKPVEIPGIQQAEEHLTQDKVPLQDREQSRNA